MAKANNLLKIGVPVVLGVLLSVIFIATKHNKKNENAEDETETVVLHNLTKKEQMELGMEDGDTSTDTLRTMLVKMKEIKSDISKVKKDNQRLQEENQQLLSKNNIQLDPTQIATIVANQVEQKMADLKENLLNQSKSTDMATDSIDLPTEAITTENNNYKWINPLDVPNAPLLGDEANQNATGNFLFDALSKSQSSTDDISTPEPKEPESIPFYTIPKNSTLTGSVTMTALIGRVPIQGALMDPFPFKVVIGQENLIANGIILPDVQGAIVSGTASGDWTLSCVKGKVDSITFVFRDGRIMSIPSDEGGNSNGSGEEIAWLSTPNGTPCIPGEKKTNAPTFLASQFLLSGAEAAADGFAQAQVESVNTGNGIASAVTGDARKYIAAQGIGGGVKATAEWYRQRYGQMFDAIYVPPARKVVVNISKDIKIDYDFKARKVKYSVNNKRNFGLD